jgi:hypothetical protein
MKLKALMLSTAVLLASAAVAFAQTSTNHQPPISTASPTSPGTMQPSLPSTSNEVPDGTGSSARQPTNMQPDTTGMNPDTTGMNEEQPSATTKHRAMASRRMEPRAGEHDRATTALNLLVVNGYRDFSTFRAVGQEFEATANQDGKTVTVMVNPDTKTVRPQG